MLASYALLGILGEQSSYGYDLKKNYDRLYGYKKPLAFGQVYATLARLRRDDKIIVKASSERGAGPERKRYNITEIGRKDLEAWLAKPEQAHPEAQIVLFTKVVTAILLDKEPYDYLDAQRISHLQRMHELTNQRRSGGMAQMLRADYAIFHLEADLRWIDATLTRLKTLKKEVRNA